MPSRPRNSVSAKSQEDEYEWPTKPHEEQVVLGNALLNWPGVREHIGVDLFWGKPNRRILSAMLALEDRGEPVDCRTVVAELERHGIELGDLGVLAELEGVPVFQRRELNAYIRSLENVHTLREAAMHAQKVVAEACMNGADVREVERSAAKLAQVFSAAEREQGDAVVIELPSPWGYEDSMSYLVEDLLIENAVTMWSGESGDGKSTLALALAAAVAQGQPFLGRRTTERPVLYMDRENPVAIIKERLLRLGIPDISDHLKIWGTWWRDHYPPAPDAASILAYAERVKPLIVWDSLIGFANCDENSSYEMRRHTSHYRRLTDRGATVLIIHHRSEKGESKYRGSTDIRANMDAAWEVARDDDTTAAEALGRMRLTPYKTRNQPGKAIRIEYRDGVFVPLDAPSRPPVEIVVDLVRTHPGANQKEMKKLGSTMGLGEHRVVAAIEDAALTGKIVPKRTKHNTLRYYLPEADLGLSA
jgi:hypothetical protein